jgi:glycosyltransferase involved in cell wall biosynthesis
MRLSVIIASGGRRTLKRSIDSVVGQLETGDELLVDVNDDAPWGHRARNRQMQRAAGDGVMFLDDDDVYLPGALSAARSALKDEPMAMHIFRMRYAANQTLLWSEPHVQLGNVSTQMVCAPTEIAVRHQWSERYEGDYDFIRAVSLDDLLVGTVFHDEIIALVRPEA